MEIRHISWQETIDIRHKVLWPNNPPEFCKAEGDDEALHLGAYVNEELVCVASLFFDSDVVRLRKFAALPATQGQGVGSTVLKAAFKEMKARDVSIFWCDAREAAMGIYRKFGMKPEGERFYKGDIPYFKMAINLAKRP
ncbi:GNAT family N-acetyltransferase [Grimontia sp. NTOU-MAR1]|uniref:GNAT family N-acetyltransferase n=1 Tax=Grimontia sp. NTOU-MAR1 TaxID=3111011 RepID=UPI002DB75CFC|nr:GNAT family N-acetyltransferase [Grimontia sp. NTOU-MAR1]WRW00222.1 GNAT family N-acetyltransferase [Grimontia sp. NTOU-MAR1]